MQTFNQFAKTNLRIDQDNNGLFALVPDQSGEWMTVRCVESKKSVHASHCSCRTFAKKQSCGHVELVQAYWNKIYKVEPVEAPVAVETPAAPKVRKPRNGLVRKVRNGGLVKVEQKVAPVAKVEAPVAVEAQAAVKEAEKIVSTPAITDISKKGELYSNRGFQLLR